jgi:hypothetical protein
MKKGKRWVVLASSRCPDTKKLLIHNSLHKTKEEADSKVNALKSEFTLINCDIIFTTEAPFIQNAKKKRVLLWKKLNE